jgi:hypothetical protein
MLAEEIRGEGTAMPAIAPDLPGHSGVSLM